jgi:hypothetical protein
MSPNKSSQEERPPQHNLYLSLLIGKYFLIVYISVTIFTTWKHKFNVWFNKHEEMRKRTNLLHSMIKLTFPGAEKHHAFHTYT